MNDYTNITQNQTKPYRCRECFERSNKLYFEDVLKDVESSGCTLLTPKNEYKNGYTRIKYICPKHGLHEMRASNYHAGKRCPDCAKEKARDKYSFTPDEVFDIVASLGGELKNKEDYINQDIKNLDILCPRCHKNIFRTSLKHFKQHGGQSCPECYRKESVGERKIRQWLENNNIEFVQEKWFPDCRDINPLPFDFYLPKLNKIIEFDGKQHFEENHFFSARHLKNVDDNSITSYTQYHDDIKTNYCLSHNISLIRITYLQVNSIEKILEEEIIK